MVNQTNEDKVKSRLEINQRLSLTNHSIAEKPVCLEVESKGVSDTVETGYQE